jgi:photosystem II reaction center protein PsbP
MIKLSARQYLLIAAGLVIVLIIIGISFFSTSGNNTNKERTSTQISNVTKTTTQNYPTLPVKDTYTYTGNTYRVTFPKSWNVDTDTLYSTQGKMLYLQPNTSDTTESANVAIEINSTDTTSLSNMSQGLSFLGLKRTDTTIGGISAEKFSGMVTLSQKMLHNTIYLFSKNNQIYLIKLSYVGSNYDAQLEEEFTQFVNSFNFN